MIDHDIKICTPYYNTIDERVQQAIYNLLDSEELKCAWIAKQGTAIAFTRNLLVNEGKSDLEYQKINDDFTHYLFIDSDVVVKVEDVKRLMSYDLDIISGAYKSRENEYSYVGGLFKKHNGKFVDALKFKTDSTGLMEVDWVGGGCLLIKKKVFESLPYPWFRHPIMKIEKNGNTHCSLMFEDVGFCMLAKEHGYKIWMDCDTEVEHLARAYETNNTSQLELLFRNVNDDVNKMFQLIRQMSYRIKYLENKEDSDV